MKTIEIKSHFRYFTAIALLLGIHINAQTPATDLTPDNIATTFNLTLQHTTLVVSNFAESKKFYTEILGLKEKNAQWLPENQMFISLGNNLELHVGEVQGVEIVPSKFNHFAISANDLDGYLKHLKSHGVVYSSLGGEQKDYIQKRPDGVRQTFIQDPDGYWIEINDAN